MSEHGTDGPEHESADGTPLYGVAAGFASPEALLAAAQAIRPRGFGRLDAYTPHPVAGMDAALGLARDPIAGVALGGWALGASGFFGMAVYATTIDYRFNIGGRPELSWPSFVVPSVAAGVLLGAVAIMLGFLALCRLPRLNHPAFNIDGFERATRDRFWLCVQAPEHDGRFDADAVEAALRALPHRPLSVQRVAR